MISIMSYTTNVAGGKEDVLLNGQHWGYISLTTIT